MSVEINIPAVIAEVTAAFQRYEEALVTNDIETLNGLFWPHPYAVRYGATENLYGYADILAFRSARSPRNLMRRLRNTTITSFGRDFAMAHTEFLRDTTEAIGRQSQTWLKTDDGWKIAGAHVSLMNVE